MLTYGQKAILRIEIMVQLLRVRLQDDHERRL